MPKSGWFEIQRAKKVCKCQFAAEIRSAGGAPIAHFDELIQSQGVSSIELSRDQFPPGTYQIDFWGIDGGRRVQFAPLVFQVPSP